MADREIAVEQWQALVAQVRECLGMYGVRSFGEACALLVGFEIGRGEDMLKQFHEWLAWRRPDYDNLAFSSQVAREVTGSSSVRMSEEHDQAALVALFDLLSEFLADDEFETRRAEAREHLRAASTALRQDQHPRWRQALEEIVPGAITWRARPEIGVFVATRGASHPDVDFDELDPRPVSVLRYELEDDEGLLPGWSVTSFDLELAELPEPLAPYLTEALRIACDATGGIVWLGFEASFDYEEILTPASARSVYGVCAPGMEPTVAVEDDEIVSPEWAATVEAARRRLRG